MTRSPHYVNSRKSPLILFTRVVILAVGLSFIIAERGLTPPYVFSGLITAAPFMWNTIFLITGVVTVLWGILLWPLLGRLSYVLLITAMASRALGLTFLVEQPPIVPVALYGGFIAVTAWAWPRAWAEIELVEEKVLLPLTTYEPKHDPERRSSLRRVQRPRAQRANDR